MIHKACIPVYMNSGKIVAGRDGTGRVDIEGSTRGPRGPKKCNIGTGRHPYGPTQLPCFAHFNLCVCQLFHYKSKLSNMKETQKGF